MMMRKGSARAGSGKRKGPRINEGKHTAILMAAQQLFASSGFDGAAMNAVAARAGVSKATVYAHFGNKERLFKRILGDRIQEMSERWDSLLDQEGSLHERLKSVAHVILDISSSPAIRCVHRALTLPSSLSPCNHDELWSSCFGRYDKVMRGILAREVANGTLEIKDVALASSQFFGLVGGEAIARALLLGDGVARTESVDHAVDIFIRGNMPVRKAR